jgi:hypothetical protein
MRNTIFLSAGLLTLSTSALAQDPAALFETNERCQACHNGMLAADGSDLSVGVDWRSSMMANAARDPYWHAAVRREVTDHPSHQGAIEDKCSTCHMPMQRFAARNAGAQGQVLSHIPDGAAPAAGPQAFSADGVSCNLCHQITAEGLGEESSYTGGFVIDTATPAGQRTVHGPVDSDPGRQRVMRSSSGFDPHRGDHVADAAFCGSCHTLHTHAYGPDGEVTGELAEQTPYLEWLHSSYNDGTTCQDCHMPEAGRAAISSVQPKEHPAFSQHVFRGGNFFMPRVLNAERAILGVQAGPMELEATAASAADNLATSTAELSLQAGCEAGVLELEATVRNLAGHKLPTAYPSRRVWLHVMVRDASGDLLFESGAPQPDGSIAGNDNDLDASAYEPHHTLIERPDQVQIWEPILGDPSGAVTTGLLTATGYLKDNRLLPAGFDAASAHADVAVYGAALEDPDFIAGGDTVRYRMELGVVEGPLQVSATLLYQPIGYRWAHNLADTEAPEPQRWVGFYQDHAQASWTTVAEATLAVEAPLPEEPAAP